MSMREDLEKAIEVSRRLIVKEEVSVDEIAESARNLTVISMMMQNEVVKKLTLNRKAA